jgi:hypothetical protein
MPGMRSPAQWFADLREDVREKPVYGLFVIAAGLLILRGLYIVWQLSPWAVLWIAAVVAAATGFPVETLIESRDRRDQRLRDNHICLTCGYDCRATPTQCPECGHDPAVDHRRVG